MEDLDLAQKDADSAKSSLLTVQAEIKKLKAEKDQMMARLRSAEACATLSMKSWAFLADPTILSAVMQSGAITVADVRRVRP